MKTARLNSHFLRAIAPGICIAFIIVIVDVARAQIPIRQNDTVLFYGNAMVERLMESGELEAYLQLTHPGKDLKVRSLAWTGDEVGHQLRPDNYSEHLRMLLEKWPAQVVIVGFGLNEAFAGPSGLRDFRSQYEAFLAEMNRRHPGASLVLLSPIAIETGGPADHAAGHVEVYANAVRDLARSHGAGFVDLFAASRKAYDQNSEPLTVHGIHLNEIGVRLMSEAIASAMIGDAAVNRVKSIRQGERPALYEVAAAAAQKAEHVASLVRIKNAVLYFGQRRRPHEYAAELPRYFQMIEQSEKIVYALARNPAGRFADFPRPSLPSMLGPIPTTARSEGDKGDTRRGAQPGVIRKPRDQQREFTVAPGYALELFASEAEFPDMRNPIQIAFDARGRLWVATMPSFPLTEPGLPRPDKVVILEDVNRDGKADKCTVFAEGFDVLDGIALHERGVIISSIPHLWLLQDTDGDDRADTRTELIRGIDGSDTHHGGMVSVDPRGHVIFCDGVFNRSQFETPHGVVRGIDATTYRLYPDTGKLAVEWQTLSANAWKVAFDRYGNPFQRYGGGAIKDGLALTWTPFGVHHPTGKEDVFNYQKGSCVTFVSSPNFPDEYQGAIASATLLGVYAVTLTKLNSESGRMVGADRLDVLTTKNPVFRPTDIQFGFDGAMYIADFCSILIGQGPNPTRDPLWDPEHGRIWRVVYTGKPTLRDWPQIEKASTQQLLDFLRHPQQLARDHARIRLRGLGESVIPALDAWVARLDGEQPGVDQSRLEAAWLFQSRGVARPELIKRLMASADPHYRAAAVQLIRFQFEQLPDARAMLAGALRDSQPRVGMSAVNAVSHLKQTDPTVETLVAAMHSHEGPVAEMFATLTTGSRPARGRSVPILQFAPETVVRHWLQSNTPAIADPAAKTPNMPVRTFRTYFEAKEVQPALLSVKHPYLDIDVNGQRMLSNDYMYNQEHQVAFEVQPGMNVIQITFRRLRGEGPPIYLYDPLGQPVTGLQIPSDASTLASLAQTWETAHAADAGALRVQAVPHLMQFAPTKLEIKAGQEVRIIFDNPDLMPHNLVIVAPGSDDEVGTLADQLASQPDALAKHFVPSSKLVLHATPLVDAKRRHELKFTAPSEPGDYPYLCTFPGHWRTMRGILKVIP